AAAEKDLTVVRGHHVIDADMAGENVIGGVTALNIRTLVRTHYSGRVFVDCTGDAWVGYFAGAKYRFGRESKAEHGEDMAPAIADTLTMSGCIRSGGRPFFFEEKEEISYHAPEWVPKLPESDEEFGRVINDKARMYWWLEAPNTYDDMWDGEQTRDALFLVILGYLDHLKNHWSGREAVKNSRFRFASIINGRRESRRLIGDYVLTQDDCTAGRRFEDAVSYSGWALDIHHPMGIYSGAEGPLYCGKRVNLPHIPYRCLYSVNIDNLLMAGRNVSVTHIALGTIRVQNTIATLGQAAGTAAAMCVKLGESPRGIYERHMKALQQQLLKDDQYIPGLQNEDSSDPCLHAETEASSVCRTEIFRPIHGNLGPWIPMDQERATIGGFSASHGNIEQIWLRLRSDLDVEKTVTIHVKPLGDLDTSAQNGVVSEAKAVVMPKEEGWVRFPVFVPVKASDYHTGSYLLIWMDQAEGISWRSVENLSNYRRIGVRKADGSWKMTSGFNLDFTLKEPHDVIADCSPGMAVNGYSRILSAGQYEWVSDPNEALPQWLNVVFRAPAKIRSVSLVFDTDMTNPGNSSLYKYPAVRTCVRDYQIEVFDGEKWIAVAKEKDNYMRKRVHRFPPVFAGQVRVTVFSTWGDPSARISEIRAES
ncbi:MAG: FAD-dependent oxidoreductase, partial [Lachnospiraceae bacterium]|nr:FAD-dependent oxidoreductase [Lachnospiraceae bacterium]